MKMGNNHGVERRKPTAFNEKEMETETETAIISDTPVQIPMMDEFSWLSFSLLAFLFSCIV